MRSPIVVTIASGKGGVGKSLVAANLATAIARVGMRTLLVDADLGSPSQHTLFGLDRIGAGLAALLDGRASSLDEVTVPTGVSSLGLVPGVGGVANAANPAHARKLKLARAFGRASADVVVVDLGAGTAHNVVDLFLAGHVRIVVVAPQLTALQSAYCLAKTAMLRAARSVANCPRELDALDAAFEAKALARLDEGVRVLADAEPELARRVVRQIRHSNLLLVGNLLEAPASAGVVHALARMTREFLGVQPVVGALLPRSASLHASVDRRRPALVTGASEAAIAQPFETLAERVVVVDPESVERAREGGPASDWPPAPERATEPEEFVDALRAQGRREPRVPASHPVYLHHGAQVHVARLADLSTRGALVASGVALEVGDRIGLARDPSSPPTPVVVRRILPGRYGVEAEDTRTSLSKELAPQPAGKEATCQA